MTDEQKRIVAIAVSQVRKCGIAIREHGTHFWMMLNDGVLNVPNDPLPELRKWLEEMLAGLGPSWVSCERLGARLDIIVRLNDAIEAAEALAAHEGFREMMTAMAGDLKDLQTALFVLRNTAAVCAMVLGEEGRSAISLELLRQPEAPDEAPGTQTEIKLPRLLSNHLLLLNDPKAASIPHVLRGDAKATLQRLLAERDEEVVELLKIEGLPCGW